MMGIFVQLNLDSKYARSKPIGYVICENGCWQWVGAITHGYGRWGQGGKLALAYRVIWERHHGPVPEGCELHHRCHNRACVNPAHLELITSHAHKLLHDTPTTRNAQKQSCHRGHPFDDANTLVIKGHRHCRACTRDRHRIYWRRARGAALQLRPSERTHCPAGHPYDAANTHRRGDTNERQCLTCRREQKRAYNARLRALRHARQSDRFACACFALAVERQAQHYQAEHYN